jgi:hypothetical protein
MFSTLIYCYPTTRTHAPQDVVEEQNATLLQYISEVEAKLKAAEEAAAAAEATSLPLIAASRTYAASLKLKEDALAECRDDARALDSALRDLVRDRCVGSCYWCMLVTACG